MPNGYRQNVLPNRNFNSKKFFAHESIRDMFPIFKLRQDLPSVSKFRWDKWTLHVFLGFA